MKHQSQHNLIDPELPTRALEFEYDGNDDPDPPNDAYVIGENGNTLRGDAYAVTESPTGSSRWARPAAFVLGFLFVVLTVWNLSHFFQGPPPRPRLTPFQVKQALYLGVMKIDAFRRVNGATPDTLAQVGLPASGAYSYERVDPAHYVLSFRGNGAKLEYNSNESKERFFGSPQEVLMMGDSK